MGDATTRRNKILIVDDDASLAEMLQLVLRQEGFETVWCATGDAALQVFRDSNPASTCAVAFAGSRACRSSC